MSYFNCLQRRFLSSEMSSEFNVFQRELDKLNDRVFAMSSFALSSRQTRGHSSCRSQVVQENLAPQVLRTKGLTFNTYAYNNIVFSTFHFVNALDSLLIHFGTSKPN